MIITSPYYARRPHDSAINTMRKPFLIVTDEAVRPLNNTKLLLQFFYMTALGYHNQSDYDTMKHDPALLSCFNDEDLGGWTVVKTPILNKAH